MPAVINTNRYEFSLLDRIDYLHILVISLNLKPSPRGVLLLDYVDIFARVHRRFYWNLFKGLK
jgi:hypothetical protein